MEYIVLNLEGSSKRREIYQIGAVRVDEKLNVQETIRMMVEPGDREALSDAALKLRLWCGSSPLVIWGMEDLYLLQHSLDDAGIDLDWEPEVFDGQEIFREQMGSCDSFEGGRQAALSSAMMLLGMKPRRTSNALTGSMNMVRVLQNLSFSRGIQSQRFGEYGSFISDYDMCDYDYELAM